MADREKVIREIQYCTKDCADPGEDECNPGKCRYAVYQNSYDYDCKEMLLKDALALLKEQEPRVMTVEEIRSGVVEVVWLEDADKPNVIPGIWFRLSNEGGDEAVDIHVMDGFVGARLEVYGKLWRCWTSRPTPEQMRNMKWEEDNG